MKNTNNILVIGGTGKTGRKVVKKLNKLGHNVRVGSRSAKPTFDWDNSQTWSESMQGMDAVYITFQPDLAVPGALEAIEELTKQAKRCGVNVRDQPGMATASSLRAAPSAPGWP